MKDEVHNLSCSREADLVSFLYNEMSDAEKSDFQRHLHGCGECSAQFASFRDVRSGIATWKNQTVLQYAPATNPAQFAPARKPSALAALREFFSLSPVWLKGAVALASLVFCLLAGFAVLRLRNTAPANVAMNQATPAIINVEKPKPTQTAPEQSTPAMADAGTSVRKTLPNVRPQRQQVALKHTTRPLSRVERQELAADLRLIEPRAEGGLELLSDQINQ